MGSRARVNMQHTMLILLASLLATSVAFPAPAVHHTVGPAPHHAMVIHPNTTAEDALHLRVCLDPNPRGRCYGPPNATEPVGWRGGQWSSGGPPAHSYDDSVRELTAGAEIRISLSTSYIVFISCKPHPTYSDCTDQRYELHPQSSGWPRAVVTDGRGALMTY